MVGGEGRVHVDAEDGKLHGEEGCTQARPEQGEDQAREHGQPDRQEHGLGAAVAELAVLDDGADRVVVQAEAAWLGASSVLDVRRDTPMTKVPGT